MGLGDPRRPAACQSRQCFVQSGDQLWRSVVRAINEAQRWASVGSRIFGTSAPYPPSPAANEISTWLYTVTIRRAFVRSTEHTLLQAESNRLMLPSHYQSAFPRRRVALTSRLRQLPARPIPTTSSSNPLPVCACRVPDTPWQDRPPSVVSPQRSRY